MTVERRGPESSPASRTNLNLGEEFRAAIPQTSSNKVEFRPLKPLLYESDHVINI